MMGGGALQEAVPTVPTTKKQLLSDAMKRTGEWIFSQEIPSDITVAAGGAIFSLHKFPLVSKSGYIHKLLVGQDADLSMIDLSDLPGGAEAFELAAKFCYGFNFEISTTNIAMLRCAAEYLEMTDDYADANLVARTEAYINEAAMKTLSSAVTVLHSCENLLPIAEDLKIVSRCINVVVSEACKDSQFATSDRARSNESVSSINSQIKPMIDWWAEELVVLEIGFYQRVLTEMKRIGLNQGSLGAALMFYAQKSLRQLECFGRSRREIEQRKEHEQRILIETIVSLLPTEKNTIPVSFLCWLLRVAIYLETTIACRLDLEQRIGLQLEQATLDDLLIPSFSYSGDTLFDVDTVHRITVNFLEQEKHCELETHFLYALDDYLSPVPTDLMNVARLLENYLAETAPDANMAIAKFTGLAELIPEQAHPVDDGIYRAIDIYLKAHPSLNDLERKKVCSVMDCKKLSQEACAHAAQNERLPVHIVVQVLYFEQHRLQNAISRTFMEGDVSQRSQKMHNREVVSAASSPCDEFWALHQENQDLKLEVARMRIRLSNLEKDQTGMKHLEKDQTGMKPGSGKPPLYKKTLLNSVSKKLEKYARNPMELAGFVIWVLFGLCVSKGSAQLSENFYAETCSNVESIVRNAVSQKFEQTLVTVPATLRLFFHDCFVEGRDASVTIQSTPNNTAEKDYSDNLSLAGDGFDTVMKAKQAVENVCPNTVSCADILAMAARDVVALAGGPQFNVELGRRDGMVSLASNVPGNLPEPTFNLNQLNALFTRKGLNQTEMIALSGAHTVGFSHCDRFANRIYNFSSGSSVDPSLNTTYATQLQQICPRNVDPSIVANMDPITPNKFDNVYYQNLLSGKGLFTSDEALFTNKRSRSTVTTYARSPAAFNNAFVNAMIKLGRVDVKTGTEGEIRLDCTHFN